MSALDKANVEYLYGIFDGFRATMVISGATELGLFDLVEGAGSEGVIPVHLAKTQGWDAECTERLLNACVALRLLQKHTNSAGQDTYHNAGPGCCLIKSADSSLYGMFGMLKRNHAALSKLPEEVKTGSHKSSVLPHHITVHKPASEHEGQGHHHGHHGDDVESLLPRYKSMNGVCHSYVNQLVTAFDLGQYKTAVDLGAGSGAFSFELARTYPSMHVSLFEVPPVIELVKKHFVPKSEQLDVTLVAGDFNKMTLPTADLYLLAKVVHDWNHQQITSLLSKVHASLNEGGAVMLLEKCMNDAKDGPPLPHIWDMVVMCSCAGRLRSGAEYTALLKGLGFTDIKIHKTHTQCTYDVIIATKLG